MKLKSRLTALLSAVCIGLTQAAALPAGAVSFSQDPDSENFLYSAADDTPPMWGDADLDGTVSLSNLAAIQQTVDKTSRWPWFRAAINADVTGDGKVNQSDAALMKSWYAARCAGADTEAQFAAEIAAWQDRYAQPHVLSMGERFALPTNLYGEFPGTAVFYVTATQDTTFSYTLHVPGLEQSGQQTWYVKAHTANGYFDDWVSPGDAAPCPSIRMKAGVTYALSFEMSELSVAPDSFLMFEAISWDHPEAQLILNSFTGVDAAHNREYSAFFSPDAEYEDFYTVSAGQTLTVPVSLWYTQLTLADRSFKKLRMTVKYPESLKYRDTYFCDALEGQQIKITHRPEACTVTYEIETDSTAYSFGRLMNMQFDFPEKPQWYANVFSFADLDIVTSQDVHLRGAGRYARLLYSENAAVTEPVTTGFTVTTATEATAVTSITTLSTSKATTTETTATETTTVPAVTTETAPLMVWGQDNWSFDNTPGNFLPQKYRVNPSVQDAFFAANQISNTDRYLVSRTLESKGSLINWSGSCFGMTLTEILVKQGMLDLRDYGGNPVLNSNTNTPQMLSLINILQAMQGVSYVQAARQSTILSSPAKVRQGAFVRKLEQALRAGRLVKVGITKQYTDLMMPEGRPNRITWGNHAILAYGVEDCSYDSAFTGEHYDKRILIADPNYLSQNAVYDDACIYYQSETYHWIIPAYCTETRSLRTSCCWDDTAAYNGNGYLNNLICYDGIGSASSLMTDLKLNQYIAGATVEGSDLSDAVMQIVRASGDPAYDFDADEEDNVILFGVETDGETHAPLALSYSLVNPTARYYLAYADGASDCELQMDYADLVYLVSADAVQYIEFAPEGDILVNGSGTHYDITLLTDAKKCPTDWYAMQIVGDGADSVQMRLSEEGYLLSADNMQAITVSAENDTHHAAVTFSVKEPAPVLIYEIDEDTIGVRADTDGDGSFETAIPTEKTSLRTGDVNCDGAVTVADAVLLARVLAEDPAAVITPNGITNAETDGIPLLSSDDLICLLQTIAKIR